MTPTPKELPALPNFPGAFLPRGFIGLVKEPVFTSAQMQAYAREAVAASLQGIERDAARLDWVERGINGTIRLDDKHGLAPRYLHWGKSAGLSLRAAIDAAMKDAPMTAITDEQWYDIASSHAAKDWKRDDIKRAREILARLCDKGLVSMSVPVREEDEDMVLSRVIERAALATPSHSEPSEPAAQQAIDALEAAKNGLEWYRDARPMLTDGSDDEMDAQIDATVLALRASLPDVKAAEPVAKVVAAHTTPTRIEFLKHADKKLPIGTLLYAAAPIKPEPRQKCEGCNGNGEVGGLRSDGYHSEECPFCHGSGTEPRQAPSDALEWDKFQKHMGEQFTKVLGAAYVKNDSLFTAAEVRTGWGCWLAAIAAQAQKEPKS